MDGGEEEKFPTFYLFPHPKRLFTLINTFLSLTLYVSTFLPISTAKTGGNFSRENAPKFFKRYSYTVGTHPHIYPLVSCH